MTGRRRRNVAQHDIGKTAKLSHDRHWDRGVVNVGAQDHCADDRHRLGDIDPDDAAAGADALYGDLRPTSRRAAKVYDPRPSSQEPVPIIQLDQLKGGTRPIAETPSLGNIGIIELPRKPRSRGRFAPAGVANSYRHVRPASGRTGSLRAR